MRDLFDRLRVPLVFALLVILAFVAMRSDPRVTGEGGRDHSWWLGIVLDVAAPLQALMAAPAVFVRDLWAGYVALTDVRRENERLRSRVATLEEENLQYREALVASGHLERIAQMRGDLEVPLLPSQVVGQDVSPWFRSVLLDRGRNHRVLAGMPVITYQGVVGLVTATSSRAARSMLLLDRQSALDGVIQRSRSRGTVRGHSGQRLAFEFVVRDSDVRVGDVVITSGLDAIYPKGLRVGEVVSLGKAGDLLQTALLRPAVDFGRLEGVFVVLRRAPTMDLLYAEGDLPDAAEPGP